MTFNTIYQHGMTQEQKPKILIVDDTPANLQALQRILFYVDADVIEAHSGKEALDLCGRYDFALILMDAQMPEIDGYEVAKSIRDSDRGAYIPIIFLTANFTEEKFKLKGYDAGAVDYISKPFNKVILLSKVNVFLQLYRQKEEIRLAHKHAEEATAKAEMAAVESSNANESKSFFLANMSHEIRTPLNSIIGMLHFLTDRNDIPEEHLHYARTALGSAEELLQIINDILDFSKIESGNLSLEEMNFDLRRLTEDIMEVLSIKAQEKGLETILRYSADAPHNVTGDPGRVKQILYNLVGNAIKFTDHGYVMVNVDVQDVTSGETTFSIEVSDTGIGIPQDKHEYIFTKFSQADSSTTRKFGGTGLGLAITRRLIGMMGGDISLESEPGKGAVFSLTLKLKNGAVTTDRKKAANTHDSGEELEDLRILVVDDNIAVQETLLEQVSFIGATAKCVSSTGKAIEELETSSIRGEHYDIAIVDRFMPGMEGTFLGRVIRDNEYLKDIGLIAMTALPQKNGQQEFEEAGFDGFLVKPIRLSALKRMIAAVRRKQRDAGIQPTRMILQNEITADDEFSGDRADEYSENITFNSPNILLVEDNQINLQVAMKMLEDMGCVVTPAGNGVEAVNMTEKMDFDLIFMDCQMPEMDGFEATSIIKEKHGMPVIALTANALKGDREKCLEAGMDDYLSKPVMPGDLQQIMAKWVSADKQIIPDEPAVGGEDNASDGSLPDTQDNVVDEKTVIANENPEPQPPVNTDTLDNLHKALEEVFEHTLKIYVENSAKLVSNIGHAIEEGDYKTLGRSAHTLKSSSAQVGAENLAGHAAKLEEKCRNDDHSEVEPLFLQIKEEFVRVMEYLNNNVLSEAA